MNAGCLLECCNGQNVIMCSFNDISARSKAEERITYLAGLVEQSDDMIAFKDADLKVVAANDSYAKLSGHSSARDILGKNCAEIFGFSPDADPGNFIWNGIWRRSNSNREITCS